MSETVDAVVIGAGHNGLVAATLLAEAGWDVTVLEAQEEPGGAIKSKEVVPGYVTDLYSAFYPLSVASPALRNLNLEDHGLTWTHSPTKPSSGSGASTWSATTQASSASSRRSGSSDWRPGGG